ncbi:MAG: hypothetical protein JRG68_03610 [Deltaproteobacteria bacterium]|nr:hypothetical protein [Deltaproteobacteria bacterium]
MIELKLQRGPLDTLLPPALEQTADYADTAGAREAHLVIFNRDPAICWDDKIWQRQETQGKRVIAVWGC